MAWQATGTSFQGIVHHPQCGTNAPIGLYLHTPCRLFTGLYVRLPVLVLNTDLPLCTLFELVPDDLCGRGCVFEDGVGGGSHFPAGIRRVAWPGATGWQVERLQQAGGSAVRTRGASLVILDGILSGRRRVPQGLTLPRVLPVGEGGGDEGLRHPGEEFDGLVAGELGYVGGPDDGVGSE